MFVSVAGPVIEALVPSVSVAPVTVNVVLIVAAGAAAPTSSAKAIVENVRFIGLLESSTLRTRKCGGIWLIWHQARPPSGGPTSEVYLRHGPPSTPVSLYLWLNPPSIARICPVTKFDAVRKYTTASATSAGVPPRPAGVFSIIRLPRSSISSKGITPGATEFTVISGAKALDKARVSMMTDRKSTRLNSSHL